jgi:hypothetical protein
LNRLSLLAVSSQQRTATRSCSVDSVRTISHDLGYGIGDAMDYLLEDHAGN